MIFRFLLTIAFLWSATAFADIRYETLRGEKITPFVSVIAELCNRIYREYPYLYDGTSSEYTEYLRSYAQTPNGVVTIAYDGNTPIGLASGKPMEENRKNYQQPFIQKGEDLRSLFYAGELVLLPKYRGQGIREKMYRQIEAAAKDNGPFKKICIADIDEAKIKAQKPSNYVSLDTLLAKLGFVRQADMQFIATWRNINDSEETPHLMTYWTKQL